MTPLPTITPAQLRVLRLLARPRPGQLEWAWPLRATGRRCVVHDTDGHDYFHGVRPLWAAKEVAAAAGPEVDTVKKHLNHLARRGAVEGPVTVSCHCVDKRFRELDLEAVDKAEEVGQAVHQGYYRLTDVGARILAAHPLAESETPTPRTPPGRQPLRDW